MFGNYTVESRIKKDKKKHAQLQTYVIPPVPRRKMDPQEINDMLRKNVRDLALIAGGLYATKRLADAAYSIAINVANVKIYG